MTAGQRGSATLELAIIAPALLVLLALVVAAARIEAASNVVEDAAASAARAASLQRDPRAALSVADRTARDSLDQDGVECAPASSTVDTSGFSLPVGQTATVRVVVRCRVPLADLAVPGLPGHRTFTGEAISPLDRYRSRS